MIYYKITSQNLHQNNKTIIHINTIIINIKTIIGMSIPIPIINCIKIKTISIPLYNILNQIQIIHQIINHNLPLSPDKIISYHKINGNQKNKNYKIPPLFNKIHSYPKIKSKDPSKPNNKNPLSIKGNFKNLNYNNNLKIKILSGHKITEINHNKKI